MLFKIKASAVTAVYNGRDGACCCGCAGKHSSSDVSIKRAVNRLNKAIAAGEQVDICEGTYVALSHGNNRLTVVYFDER